MESGILLQCFHWYIPSDGTFWNKLADIAPHLAKSGITGVWLPPAFKAGSGGYSVGYDIYDLYDLGEFDQKGTIRTKYGTKDEYLNAIKRLHANGVQVYVDIVLNHMAAGDETEKFQAVMVDQNDRLKAVGEPEEIEAYTKFNFPGRKGKYSKFIWDWQCFTGVDYAHNKGMSAIFNILSEYGHDWDDMISDEKGNYDYLMYNDVEFRNPAVREELKRWGKWYYETTGFDGMRLDAVKHIPPRFYNEWLDYMRAEVNPNFFVVGEYWAPGQLNLLEGYLNATEGRMSLFDSALHHRFHLASKQGKDFDMSSIFHDTLTQKHPLKSVTVVDNHDTQPLQALEAPVEAWFKPLAYALTLLRQEGYPSIFYPDLFGANYTDKGSDGNDYEIWLPQTEKIYELMEARHRFAFGDQYDYFDHGNCIGWVLKGKEDDRRTGLAVVMTNGDAGTKHMQMGEQHAGRKMKDFLQRQQDEIVLDESGSADFTCPPGSVAVWVFEEAIIPA